MSVILVALGLLVALLLITEAMIVHSENHCTQRFRYFSPKVHTLKVVMYLLCKVVAYILIVIMLHYANSAPQESLMHTSHHTKVLVTYCSLQFHSFLKIE